MGLDIGDLPAKFIVDLPICLGTDALEERHRDFRNAIGGLGFHPLHLGELLGRAFNEVGNLFFHFIRSGPGVPGDDLDFPNGELRILQAAGVPKADQAAHKEDSHQDVHHHLFLDGVFSDIHRPTALLLEDPDLLAPVQETAAGDDDEIPGFESAGHDDFASLGTVGLHLPG